MFKFVFERIPFGVSFFAWVVFAAGLAHCEDALLIGEISLGNDALEAAVQNFSCIVTTWRGQSGVKDFQDRSQFKQLVKIRYISNEKRVLLEFRGSMPGAEVTPENPNNDIVEVIAWDGSDTSDIFQYLPTPTTGPAYATLFRFAKGNEGGFQFRLDELKRKIQSLYMISGTPTKNLLLNSATSIERTTDEDLHLSAHSEGDGIVADCKVVLARKNNYSVKSIHSSTSAMNNLTSITTTIMSSRISDGRVYPSEICMRAETVPQGPGCFVELTTIDPIDAQIECNEFTDEFFTRYDRQFGVVSVGTSGREMRGLVDSKNASSQELYNVRMQQNQRDATIKRSTTTILFFSLVGTMLAGYGCWKFIAVKHRAK